MEKIIFQDPKIVKYKPQIQFILPTKIEKNVL